MGHFANIILIPNKLHPWNIHFVIKLVELFQEESIILQTQVDHIQTTLVLRPHDSRPRHKVASSRGVIISPPETLLTGPVYVVNEALWDLDSTKSVGDYRRNS